MIPLGLTTSEQAAFHRALTDSHSIDVMVSLLDMEEKFVATLGSWVLGGQVVLDTSGEVTRSCQLTLLDPGHRVSIDPEKPGDALHLNRMVSVTYGVWVEEINRWVRVPVFRGPIVKASRDEDVLEVEALGKEHLLRGETGWTKVYPAGATRTWVIRDLVTKMGERRMAVPSWKAKTSKASIMVKIRLHSTVWWWVRQAAKSMAAQAWFDGGGVLRLRKTPVRTTWTFREDSLLSIPKVTVTDEDTFNAVWVKGQAPEGKKFVVESRGELPASHPNSPVSLGRNGAKRLLTDVIEDDAIRSVLDAKKAMHRRLTEIQVGSYEVEFECLPVPHLDPMDVALLAWGELPVTFRINKFTLPLTADGSMSVGFTKSATRSAAMIRWNQSRNRNLARLQAKAARVFRANKAKQALAKNAKKKGR